MLAEVDSLVFLLMLMPFDSCTTIFCYKKRPRQQGGKLIPGPINIPGVETCNGALSRDGKDFFAVRQKLAGKSNMQHIREFPERRHLKSSSSAPTITTELYSNTTCTGSDSQNKP